MCTHSVLDTRSWKMTGRDPPLKAQGEQSKPPVVRAAGRVYRANYQLAIPFIIQAGWRGHNPLKQGDASHFRLSFSFQFMNLLN